MYAEQIAARHIFFVKKVAKIFGISAVYILSL